MEYVYMQKVKPQNIAGVPVNIEVIDANNNRRTIGTTISDSSGMFTFTWNPDITGDYKVIATFAGSESYWPSSSKPHSLSLTLQQHPQSLRKRNRLQPA
jgi:hypothetical protein